MIEKIAQFNAKMKELGLDPNAFFVITFWASCTTTLQADYSLALAIKLDELGYIGRLESTGYLKFVGMDFEITLC